MNNRLTRKIKHYLFAPRFHLSRFSFNLVALFFTILGLIVGSYLTLSKIFPQVFALNDTPKTWTFNLANAGDYTTSLSTVDDSGAYPSGGAVGANQFTNPGFASDNSSWSVAAVAPSGWVEVPGSSTYSTDNFLVMKYEAKNDGGGNAVSQALGTPYVSINQTDSAAKCGAVSVGSTTAHLITNEEWMTIARNAEAQGANWFGGSVGTNFMFSGHNDNGPASALAASADDSDGYSGTNDSESSCDGSYTNFYSGDDTTSGRACVGQKRTLTLSNSEVIWDLSGNVWEWVNDSITCADTTCTIDEMPYDTSPGSEWVEFPNLATYGSITYDDIGPAGTEYDANESVGRIYTNNDAAVPSGNVHAFLRGGRWGSGAYAGPFTLTLLNAPSSSNTSIGFRCASDSVDILQSFSSSSGRAAAGGNTVSVGTVSDGKIYQSINVGDTASYNFSVYVYNNTSGEEGTAVDGDVAALYYNGSTISTSYEPAADNWYKLSGTLTGANESRQFGLKIEAGKTVIVDDFTLSKQGTYSVYTTSAYENAQVNSWDTFCEGTLSGSTCTEDASYSGEAAINYQLCTDDGSTCQSGDSWQYWDGDSWETASNTATHVNSAAELTQTAMQALPIDSQKISVKAVFTFGGADVPYLPHISIGLTTDTTDPDTNASDLAMLRSAGGTSMTSNAWTNSSSPYFSWTAGADNSGGSGVKGYCLYLGTDSEGNPATAKGLLGESPVSTAGTTCQFITSGTSIDFATSSYQGDTWLTASADPYYLNIKIIDNSGNVFAGSSAQFQFRFDSTVPTNVSYINCASGSFSNVADMNFSWPTGGSSPPASSDSHAGLLGWQYQINATDSDGWLGTTTESLLGVDNYIASGVSSYTLTEDQDSSSIVTGSNVVYFRSVDSAGNSSSDGTIRTCNLTYGGAAPYFDSEDEVTVTPSSSTSNSYALSWPAATPASGQSITNYYYMVNTSPPSTLSTLQGNASTYIDNGTSLSVSADALTGVNKGSNTVYVVAIDDADTPNYSPSNYISGTFTLNSTDPDNVGSLVASDSSIKSQSQWNVTLTWTTPSYQGAGNLTYLVYRSTDGSTFSQVGSTSGLSYVDNTPESALYYYKVYTQDGADATSSGTNAVSITPTGKWTSPPTLSSGPEAGSITTKRATITWSTSRSSDSKVQYGTSSGSYSDVEPSNSSQVTSHSISLTGLSPGTTYYYKAKWTDEDGNTGTSDEKSFTTSPAPTVKDVSVGSIGLSSAIIEFTSKDASKVKIYYGASTSFGGVKEISTSTSETTYTAQLTGLSDGTKYYYKINTFDSENEEYEGTVLDFTTLPRPKISAVRIQQVAGTAQSTLLITWTTNTEVSSIVSYYPQGDPTQARDEVNVVLTKGEHRMIIRGLLPQTDYLITVKGRDKIGNEAVSDTQRLTTATDTRPPQISDLQVEGAAIPPTTTTAQESTAQLIVSWNTDEPATSQVEFGEGTGATYSQKTQEDSNLTYNHMVIISGLTPSKVYHLRAISRDKAGNTGNSIDTVTITPKATENALDLVITNLREAFGFFGGGK